MKQFLDMTIHGDGLYLQTKVYFKPTNRNSSLSINSGHHPIWLQNILKAQVMTGETAQKKMIFWVQSQVIKERFLQKGYSMESLDRTVKKCLETEGQNQKLIKSMGIKFRLPCTV